MPELVGDLKDIFFHDTAQLLFAGTQRGIISVSDSPVVQLKFLDPSLYPQEDMDYPPYPTKTGAYLMVLCANSALYTVNTGPGTTPYPSCITAS